MNKAELIRILASKSGMKRKEAEKTVNLVFSSMADALAAGQKVQISGFGTFEAKRRAARIGRNPHTHEAIKIPAFNGASFTCSKVLKALLNK